MGEVVRLVTQREAEEAWGAYCEQAAKISDNPKLVTDQAFMRELWRRERFAKLILERLDG